VEVEYSSLVALWINDYETIPKPSNVGVKKFMGTATHDHKGGDIQVGHCSRV
jgi:hypothetical protein